MPASRKLQTNFSGGELSPLLEGRPDLAKYFNGARQLENVLVYPQGGAFRRPGTRFAAEVKDSAKRTRLIDFVFNSDQAYALEFGEQYIRVFKDGLPVTFSGSVAFPQVVAKNRGNDASARTSHTVNLPSGIAVGDLLISMISFSDDALTITWPAGWTRIATEDNTNVQTEIAYRIADGTEGGSITVTSNASVGACYINLVIQGHDPGVPPEAASVDGGAVSANPNPPSLNPAGWGSDKTLWIAVAGAGSGGAFLPNFTAYPTNYGNPFEYNFSTLAAIGMADRPYVASAENPNPFTVQPTRRWVAFTVAVKPAVVSNLPLEIPTPYVEADLFGIQYRQSADVMYMVNGNKPPQKLSRLSDTSWAFGQVNFRPPPTVEADTDLGAALTPAAATGNNIAFDADASVFLASDVGRVIVSGTARAVIITRDSATQVHADILDDFPSADEIPAGSWKLNGSPQATLNPNKSKPVNTLVTMTAGAAAFRAEDVGKYVKIYGGVVKITRFTDSTHIVGQLLSVMSQTDASNPGTAVAGAWSLEVEAWSPLRGYPSCIEFHDGRLVFGSTTAQPTTFWGSRSNDYENMGAGPLADDSIEETVAARRVNFMRWLTSYKNLIIGTGEDEFPVRTPNDSPIGGDTIPSIKPESNAGSMSMQPIAVHSTFIFAQAGKKKVYDFMDSFDYNVVLPNDLTLLSEHITGDGLVQDKFAYQKQPNSIIYACREDGQLLALTYYRVPENIVAWSRIVTDGAFESVCAIPHPDGKRVQVWAIVKRTINGEDKRNVEYLDDDLNTDCAATFAPGSPQTNWTGLDHLEGMEVDVKADGVFLGTQTVSGGGITTVAASTLEVGLHYDSTIQTMRPSIPGAMTEGLARNWVACFIRVKDSINAEINGQEIPFNAGNPFSGDKRVNIPGSDLEGYVTIRQTKPYPLTVLAVFGEVSFADKMG